METSLCSREEGKSGEKKGEAEKEGGGREGEKDFLFPQIYTASEELCVCAHSDVLTSVPQFPVVSSFRVVHCSSVSFFFEKEKYLLCKGKCSITQIVEIMLAHLVDYKNSKTSTNDWL